MAVFGFDSSKIEGIAPSSAQEQSLKRFGFVPLPIPEGYSHLASLQGQKAQQDNRVTPPATQISGVRQMRNPTTPSTLIKGSPVSCVSSSGSRLRRSREWDS
ncbi:hypothetical protein BD309DRAFT_870981 [Dichomitus squalens]|uniref:uncharacterized protein n=1 Tax=Dichomitus squalens (strain LYAD-421) TaxID=732165 RepID=UPI00044146E6|nr:uncharacterized protein DICSQDRAFT_167964 [Dichomitus squalens LYAD-421 SS1]XP_007363633.1 uncharacterized protein DICSQDRAFT_167965 [Dichomitus squalens LYAD-421 SS1]EJF63914.1 hypothetical protein DICSQDRAFT_167964 [Dichomitus squalens LYAD-421 SS1]EJF63915.1 hypothetical protein DICSQDRAFT_167965 [Dichomitus squalens LYAD-421 SS1]TBU40088.1 hypothetical protein BD309DRAFT_870981 [Dichomitus squalens]